MIDGNFYTELKKFFKLRGITQADIAAALDIQQTFVSAMFNGRRSITKGTATKLQGLYGLSAAWLLTGEGNMMAADHQPNSISQGVEVNGNHSYGYIGTGGAADATTVKNLLEQNRMLLDSNNTLLHMLSDERALVAELQRKLDSVSATIVLPQNKTSK